MNQCLTTLCLSVWIASLPIQQLAGSEPQLVHSSFEDFAAGTLGEGGVNLYVASAGRIEMINRLDLNNDGYLDLFVANDHNHVEGADVLVYWGSKHGPRSLMPPIPEQLPRLKLLDEIRKRQDAATRLPSDGGGRSILADLNNDGYEEIIFCNFKHNYTINSSALIYWNERGGFDLKKRTELPTLLAGGVVATDFNQDGFVDLAFANRGNFEHLSLVKPHGHLESYVYWNGPTGFDVKRRTSIPTITAVDCAAGDLNGDGYPELLFANNNLQQKSVYLYWGSADGFSKQRRETWKSRDPVALHLADLDRDKKLDLVVVHKSGEAELLRGTGRGFEPSPWLTLATRRAKRCAVGDLNGDGFPELVFADAGTPSRQVSLVYWGSEKGYLEKRRTELPTLEPSDVVLADFNCDGRIDIAFSNTSDAKTLDVNSYIYWNGPEGFSAADRSEALGFSPSGACAADLNHDGHQDLVLASHISGTDSRAGIDSFIYWGNARYRYSTSSMTTLRDCSALGIADLNQDGYVDVIGGYQGVIHYGGHDGFKPQRLKPSGKLEGQGVGIADLNRDGYLDLVMPEGFRPLYVEPGQESKSTRGEIVWGSKDGFNPENTTVLKLQTHFSQSVNIADLNKDGFLDLIFPGLETGLTHIFWGAADGIYSNNRETMLQAHNASTIEIADLNSDSWLDLVFGGGWDINNGSRPTTFALILWGGPDGYSKDRSLRLETFNSLEASVADLNKDGHLDIVFTNYHAYFTRRIPAIIYWGGPEKSYNESRRTALPAESSSALTIADFNKDSWLDLFVCNHVIQGDHTVGSNIFWGGPKGYAASRRQWVPSFGSHFGVGRDIGNIYDRRLAEQYISTPLHCPEGKALDRLNWKAHTPHGTGIKFQIRTAVSRQALEKAVLHGPAGAESYYQKPGAELKTPDDHRWVQYHAVFTTPDGGNTPILEEVTIGLRR